MEPNKIYNMDCLEFLKTIPDNSVNTIVTSPPYNKGYWSKNQNMNNGFHTKSRRIEYEEFKDNLEPFVYESQQKQLLMELCRVLKDDGSIFYNHIDILCEHNTIHPTYVYDYPLKQVIIWNRQNTPKLDVSYFFPITEYVFWIKKTKESKPKFNKDKCAFKKSVWDILPVRDNNHPAPFPIELAYNCITSTCDEGDLVLDPYMGSGTTALAAIKNKCNYIGSELSKKYLDMANKRIENELKQLSLF